MTSAKVELLLGGFGEACWRSGPITARGRVTPPLTIKVKMQVSESRRRQLNRQSKTSVSFLYLWRRQIFPGVQTSH